MHAISDQSALPGILPLFDKNGDLDLYPLIGFAIALPAVGCKLLKLDNGSIHFLTEFTWPF